MDKEKLNREISSVLKEFRNLLINHEESKNQQVKLKGLVETLRDALKVARDAERNAEIKKNKSLGFVAQQQEVIVKLLHIKEENEQLRETISQMESRLLDIQLSRLTDLEKKDEEIKSIKNEYLTELIKIHDEGHLRAQKLEKELDSEIQGLRSEIESQNKNIDEQSTRIEALCAEITCLKDKAAEDLEAYHNKLSEQNKVHQAELETWKAANMNAPYDPNDSNTIPQFSRNGPLNPMQISGSIAMYSGVLHPPETNSYRHQQLRNRMTQLYSDNCNDFPSIQNSSISRLPRRVDLPETTADEYEQSGSILPTEKNDFRPTENNSVSHWLGSNDHKSTSCSVNLRMPTSQFPEASNLYKLPTHTQAYPNRSLISRKGNPKSVARVVRPLPRPKENIKDNAGFRRAGEIYVEDKADDKDNESADKSSARNESYDHSELEKCAKQTSLMPAKRRKLFNAECDNLL